MAHVAMSGVAANPTGSPGPFMPSQVLRQPDGRLLVVGSGVARSNLELPDLVVVRMTPEGALDPTFGERGVVRPGLQASCGGLCQPASLQPDYNWFIKVMTGSPSLATKFIQINVFFHHTAPCFDILLIFF